MGTKDRRHQLRVPGTKGSEKKKRLGFHGPSASKSGVTRRRIKSGVYCKEKCRGAGNEAEKEATEEEETTKRSRAEASREQGTGSRLCITAGRGRSGSFIDRTTRRLPARRFLLSLGCVFGIGSLVLNLAVPIVLGNIAPLGSSSSARRGLSTRSSRSPLLCPSTSLQNLLPIPNRPLILHLISIKQPVLAKRTNPFVRWVRQRRWGGSRIHVPVSLSPGRKTGR